MAEKQESAVEKFWKEISEILPIKVVDSVTALKIYDRLKQSKETEKERLKDAYDAGVWDVGCRAVNFDEYYKRTFKSE